MTITEAFKEIARKHRLIGDNEIRREVATYEPTYEHYRKRQFAYWFYHWSRSDLYVDWYITDDNYHLWESL